MQLKGTKDLTFVVCRRTIHTDGIEEYWPQWQWTSPGMQSAVTCMFLPTLPSKNCEAVPYVYMYIFNLYIN